MRVRAVSLRPMDCHHFDACRCRSCSWLARPYDAQLAAKLERAAALLQDHDVFWADPCTSPESAFRNKAKMVVTGTVEDPALGILGEGASGVDLRDCPIHEPAIQRALPVLAAFVTRASLTPYDVAARRGELKLVLVTSSPAGELMVRFVCRSQEPVARIRKHLPWLTERLPQLRVVTVNLQPEHKAVVEGEYEIVLTEADALTMAMHGLELSLRPQSFFQTNSVIAAALYAQAQELAADLAPRTVWDLYCGVGGFGLLLAEDGRLVTGVETSAEAVAGARATAARHGIEGTDFVADDATAWARAQPLAPDLVVVNPPRRGLGDDLAGWLDGSGVPHVLYSSCNPETLARDLRAMPTLRPRWARLFDMFPHTDHAEVLVLLERAPASLPA